MGEEVEKEAKERKTTSNCTTGFQEQTLLPKKASESRVCSCTQEKEPLLKGLNIRGIIEKSCSIMFEG